MTTPRDTVVAHTSMFSLNTKLYHFVDCTFGCSHNDNTCGCLFCYRMD